MDGVYDKESKERFSLAKEVKRRLDELPGLIPEIDSYETGINIGYYGASFFDVSVSHNNLAATKVEIDAMLKVIEGKYWLL